MDLGGEFVRLGRDDGEGIAPVVNVLGRSFRFLPCVPEASEGRWSCQSGMESCRWIWLCGRVWVSARELLPLLRSRSRTCHYRRRRGRVPLIEAISRDDAATAFERFAVGQEVATVSALALIVLMPSTSERDLLKKGMKTQRIKTRSRSLVSRASRMTAAWWWVRRCSLRRAERFR
jgi:hypothetical protein